jgi:hypothetical protein
MSKHIETNGTPGLAAEGETWEKRCAELLEEREGLRTELAKVRSERDSYLKTVYHFMGKDFTPPDLIKQEMLACVGQEPPLEEFIAQLDREMRAAG